MTDKFENFNSFVTENMIFKRYYLRKKRQRRNKQKERISHVRVWIPR